MVSPSFSGKADLIKTKLKDVFTRDAFTTTRYPEQYIDEFKTDGQIRRTSELEGSIVVFGDMLECNQKTLHPPFTKGRHKDIAV